MGVLTKTQKSYEKIYVWEVVKQHKIGIDSLDLEGVIYSMYTYPSFRTQILKSENKTTEGVYYVFLCYICDLRWERERKCFEVFNWKKKDQQTSHIISIVCVVVYSVIFHFSSLSLSDFLARSHIHIKFNSIFILDIQ